jgi:serine/threonine protein kinase
VQAKLLDFGVVAFLRDMPGVPEPPGFSPRYAAPELLAGASTSASDQYAAAAALAEALGHGHALAPILQRAMAPDPSKRFASVSALASRLGGLPIDKRILVGGSVLVLLGAAAALVHVLR